VSEKGRRGRKKVSWKRNPVSFWHNLLWTGPRMGGLGPRAHLQDPGPPQPPERLGLPSPAPFSSHL
jgi:hypothetical protein